MSSNPRHIASLDLCRGLAALGVLLYHADFLFFGRHDVLLTRGYLCVDFFFLLSGYVIAMSYDRRLADGMHLMAFVWVRVARLWPLVVLSCLLGLVGHVAREIKAGGGVEMLPILLDLGANLALLPALTSLYLFPFNGAAWSIFFEMAVNTFYAAIYKYLSSAMIQVLIAAGGVGLAIAAVVYNSLDVGWSSDNILYGFPRVIFSFFLGLLIFRTGFRIDAGWAANPLTLYVLLAMSTLIMSLPFGLPGHLDGFYDLAVVVVLFPVVLVVALAARLPSKVASFALLLGGVSYSVYLLHTPLMVLYSALPQVLLGNKVGDYVPWAGVIFLPLLLWAAYLTWVLFELPAQRWLRSCFVTGKTRSKVDETGGSAKEDAARRAPSH